VTITAAARSKREEALAKTKSVNGKEYPASAFAHVGDANDPATWLLPIPDVAHVRDALVTFKQTSIPDAARKRVARRLTSAAKKFGIDASAFAKEHGVKASEAAQTIFERAGDGNAKRGRAIMYSEMLAEARLIYPNDEGAQQRWAQRAMDRAQRVHARRASFRATQRAETSQTYNLDAFQNDESFEYVQRELAAALLEKFGRGDDGYQQYTLCETFPGYIIAQGPDGELYRITYAVDADEITFGDPQEVEATYVPVELAKMDLAAANRLFDGSFAGAERILRARTALQNALDVKHSDELAASVMICDALSEHCANVIAAGGGNGAILCSVQQAHVGFLAREAASEDGGWTWPVQVMQSGWAAGTLESASGNKLTTPHYFPPAVVSQVAQAANGARFRRRHPETGDGANAPELTAGWVSDGKMTGSAARAKVNLLKSETEIRSTLLAAQEAGKLDLFSVSIFAYFGFKESKIDGKPALVATSLQKFVGLDMCAEPGAGGMFLG
jgi:hypothetical protein